MAGSAAGSAPCKGLAHSPLIIAGARLGDMPDAGLLARTLADGDDPLSDTQEDAGSEPAKASHQLMPTGPGLPALPKKVVERIHAGEYIDFSELPPAKGKVRPLHQGLDGQVILVQAQDLLQSKKLIQDLPTWVQCFAVYVAVVVQKQLNGLCHIDSKGEQEVPLAIMGSVRPEFQARSSQLTGTTVVKDRP